MAIVNRSFSVNVTPGMMPPIVHVSEYDVGRAYTVSILDEQGNTFTIPSGTSASIEGTLNGSVGFTQSATVSNNQVSFTLTESMTAKAGRAWCKIKLTQNSQPIQTCAFILAVDRAGVEADTVIGAPGFQEQINEGIAEYFDNDPPFFELPSGGQSGQALLSDGQGGAVWGTAQSSGTGLTNAAKQALMAVLNAAIYGVDSSPILLENLENALNATEPDDPTPTPPEPDDPTPSDITFELGGFGDNSNKIYPVALDNRARMTEPIQISKRCTITPSSGYEIAVYVLDSADKTTSPVSSADYAYAYTSSSGWTSSPFSVDAGKYAMVIMRKLSGADFTQDEVSALSSKVTFAFKQSSENNFISASYEVGGLQPNRTSLNKNTLETRARNATWVPCTYGVFTPKTGYEICVYESSTATETGNLTVSAPPWSSEPYDTKSDSTAYVKVCLKKTSGNNFSLSEMANLYGTAFTFS